MISAVPPKFADKTAQLNPSYREGHDYVSIVAPK